jgi:predicted RNA-binding protein YlxR (DUF448 family)
MTILPGTTILLRMRGLKKSTSAAQPVILKHVPERTCIACHEVKPKREMVRLVYTSEGVVEVDASGRKPGRGAYLCQSPECWNKGVNKGKLEHALRGKINAENRARLMKFGATVRGGEGAWSRTGDIS